MSEAVEEIKLVLEKATSLVEEGRVEKAIRMARNGLEGYDTDDEMISMLASWNQAERDGIQKLITLDEMAVTKARVTKQFLGFLRTVEERLRTNEEKTLGGDEIIVDPVPPVFANKKQVLVLYSSEDKPVWQDLQKHFFLLFRMADFHFVDMHRDLPDDLQNPFEYQQAWVEIAEKVVCLITTNILAYPTYPLAELAAEQGKLIPVKVEVADLSGTIFEPLGSLPSDNRFISEWPNANSAMVDIASKLRTFLQKIIAE